MADIDLKTETPDTSLPSTGFLFGADSQSAASPSVYSTQAVATALLGSTSLTGATVTADAPVLNLAQTWNNAAVTFTGLKANVTDTASAAGSLLMDLQVGGSSKFNVDKNGTLEVRTGNGANAIWTGFGTSVFGSGVASSGKTSSAIAMRGSTTEISLRSTGVYSWTSSSTDALGTIDTILTRRAAANLRLGAADAAAPVAQTLSVQSVVAGTTNTAGANLTITGSQGTGTGAGGSIIFQVAPAGSSGTAQNALIDRLTLSSASPFGVTVTGDLKVNNNIQLAGSNAGIYNAAANMTLGDSSDSYAVTISGAANKGVSLKSAGVLSWTNGTSYSGTADTILLRDAANTLALRNGANAQESRVYGSFTATDNFQRMSIKTLRESSGALSGASYTTTIAIPAYAVPVGVTTRVTTAITGATSYDVGDGTDVDLWGATIGVTLGSQSRTADFTAVGAVDAAATSRTVTLTANGSNFTGGVVEICLHYLTTEAD